MRILVVSHNVFSSNESMGKTLSSYFADCGSDELAQFYVHSQVPTIDLCKKYYRVTDKEAIKSILGFRIGTTFTEIDIQKEKKDARIDTGITASLYQKARKRTPLIYIGRNLWWKLSRWKNLEFNKWLDDIEPECVFLASGDYAFIYDIALQIAKERKIPLAVSCMDDHYFYNSNEKKFLGRISHHLFMKSVYKTMQYASQIYCICEKMSEDYSYFFGKKCVTIHTATSISKQIVKKKNNQISYLGNLGYNRYKQLIDIGKTLKELNLEPNHIDVYSTETRNEILKEMNEQNGIVFHGAISSDEVLDIMGKSLAVVHTESFDDKNRQLVKYSVSTKIADSLSSGTCIFAYGPEEVASIQYLKINQAAVCCGCKKDLKNSLIKLITNTDYREKIIMNAERLAKANHMLNNTPKKIRSGLLQLIEDNRK